MARPSIVPIALTLDDRTGYTLWAPPWEEDGEEWQAFLGTSDDDTSCVHLFPTPAALAAYCRTHTDHDLADHPVWPVVAGLGAADLTPDDDHRFDLDGVYDIAADNPDRWAVEELAATIDIVSRLAECLDTGDEEDEDGDGDGDAGEGEDDEDDGSEFEAVADLVSRPEIGALGLGVEAFVGRTGEDSWVRLGAALDELWEDVVEELGEHLDWTGGGTVLPEDYPAASETGDEEELTGEELAADELVEEDLDDHIDAEVEATAATTGPGTRTIRGGRLAASPAATPEALAAAAAFWEEIGILPVEIVVPEGAGLTLRCYVEDTARFLGRDGEIYLFATPAELSRFCAGDEDHDLTEIATWPEVVATDTPPLPAEQDRYDLTELTEVLTEVANGAAGLVDLRVFAQPIEGVRDIAEYAGLERVERLLAPASPLGRVVARGENEPDATLTAEDAAAVRGDWLQVVTAAGGALVFRD